MKTIVTYDYEEHATLPGRIIKAITDQSKKNWGCKFISRETGEELTEMSVLGLFINEVQKALKGETSVE